MKEAQRLDTSLRGAFLMVLFGLIIAVGEIVHSQAPNTQTVHLGAEVWIVVAGGLVSVGVNLEQLRRVRADMREAKAEAKDAKVELRKLDERHHNAAIRNDTSNKEIGERLTRIEVTLTFLAPRPAGLPEPTR